MASGVLLAFFAIAGCYIFKVALQFRRNLLAARASGIKYTVVPFYAVNRLYQLSCIILIPLMRELPESWTFRFDLTLDWGYKRRYQLFKQFGTDTFMTVSPERIVLYTADADVVSQIASRRADFPKPVEVYESLKIYGENVISAEGQVWRHHRKIVSPPFTEKNNHLVWRETLKQGQDMVNSWVKGDKEGSKTIYTLAGDSMRLSLYVISRAGFGVGLQWPGSEQWDPVISNDEERKTSSHDIGEGHILSYTDALRMVLRRALIMLVVPSYLLQYLPFKAAKETYEAYIEWGKYMSELLQAKKAALRGRQEGEAVDLMAALLKAADVTVDNNEKGETALALSLSDEEILGNTFGLLLAGHETTGNSIHFCLVLLAIHTTAQRQLQSDLDEISQGRPVTEWSYEEVIPKLFGSMAGAVLNEELRLIAPVTGIPKSTRKNKPQPLIVDGRPCTVPANTYIQLMSDAIHRNPNYWPTGPPADPTQPAHPLSNLDNDLEEFKPERWILQSGTESAMSMPEGNGDADAENLGVNTAADTSAALYRPVKGAYIPFSEGYRSCIGRRFAQVEIFAVLALIFTTYSVELGVDDYASDEELQNMNEEEKKNVWTKAKAEVERKMREDMGSVLTLQLRKGAIGLRLVKRGNERFH